MKLESHCVWRAVKVAVECLGQISCWQYQSWSSILSITSQMSPERIGSRLQLWRLVSGWCLCYSYLWIYELIISSIWWWTHWSHGASSVSLVNFVIVARSLPASHAEKIVHPHAQNPTKSQSEEINNERIWLMLLIPSARTVRQT